VHNKTSTDICCVRRFLYILIIFTLIYVLIDGIFQLTVNLDTGVTVHSDTQSSCPNSVDICTISNLDLVA
jgi:hypothetical protein